MTKILNFALKIKEVVRRVAHAKSSNPATPPPPQSLKRALVRQMGTVSHLATFQNFI